MEPNKEDEVNEIVEEEPQDDQGQEEEQELTVFEYTEITFEEYDASFANIVDAMLYGE